MAGKTDAVSPVVRDLALGLAKAGVVFGFAATFYVVWENPVGKWGVIVAATCWLLLKFYSEPPIEEE